MHACGHDGHTAGLYGALLIINDLKNELCRYNLSIDSSNFFVKKAEIILNEILKK